MATNSIQGKWFILFSLLSTQFRIRFLLLLFRFVFRLHRIIYCLFWAVCKFLLLFHLRFAVAFNIRYHVTHHKTLIEWCFCSLVLGHNILRIYYRHSKSMQLFFNTLRCCEPITFHISRQGVEQTDRSISEQKINLVCISKYRLYFGIRWIDPPWIYLKFSFSSYSSNKRIPMRMNIFIINIFVGRIR